MHVTRQFPPARRHDRRGLAPLELVLALPLMLFVMALMINIGAVGAWKVREQANVRNASWRTLHLRSGDANPNPPLWPANAAINGGSGSDATQTDAVWNVGDAATPSVRGDVVIEPSRGRSLRVNRMLEMDRGVHDGSARLERQIPLLRGLLPDGGRYAFDIQQNLLDGNWEYHNMGFGRNTDRRAERLYEIEPEDFGRVRQWKSRLDNVAMRALVNFPLRRDLAPLDADPDLYRLSMLPPQSDSRPPGSAGGAPDFYPGFGVRRACLADPDQLRLSDRYTDYLEAIRRLPSRMARDFISWYQARIDYLEAQDPPIPGSEQEIQQLQNEIDLLNRFLAALPAQNR